MILHPNHNSSSAATIISNGIQPIQSILSVKNAKDKIPIALHKINGELWELSKRILYMQKSPDKNSFKNSKKKKVQLNSTAIDLQILSNNITKLRIASENVVIIMLLKIIQMEVLPYSSI